MQSSQQGSRKKAFDKDANSWRVTEVGGEQWAECLQKEERKKKSRLISQTMITKQLTEQNSSPDESGRLSLQITF